MIKALIFDLDNTLVFVQQAGALAYSKACKKNGFEIAPEAFIEENYSSRRWNEFLPKLTGTDDPEVLQKIRDAKAEFYPSFFKNAPVNKPLIERMNTAIKDGCKIAVATTASRVNAEALLKHIGVLEKLDLLLTGEDVAKPKPDPEVYLKAAETLGVKPEECLVYEDSENGVKAAKAAGTQCIKIEPKDFE